jgi:hypothetical protein
MQRQPLKRSGLKPQHLDVGPLSLLIEIARGIHIVISNQEKQMATAADLTTAVDALTTAVQALEAKVQGAAPTVLQSDLDPIVASLTSLTTSVEALVSSPPA